jgi:hypothetical protein
MFGWTTSQHHALLFRRKFPDRMHVIRIEDVLADSHGTLGALCEKLGLEPAESLRYPSWNGKQLDQVYPWGTIRQATPEANLATANELDAAERDEIRARAWPYLQPFGYERFV